MSPWSVSSEVRSCGPGPGEGWGSQDEGDTGPRGVTGRAPAPRLTHHHSPCDRYTVRSASCIRNRENRLPQRRSGLLFSTPAPRDRAILSSRRDEDPPSGPLWVPVQRKPHLPPPAHHSEDQRSTGNEGPPLPTRTSLGPPWCLAICPQTREAPTGLGWGPEHVARSHS